MKIFSSLFFLSLICFGCFNKKNIQKTENIKLLHSGQNEILNFKDSKDKFKNQWKTVTKNDPNSKEPLNYSGLLFSDLIEPFIADNSYKEVKFTSKDGYVVTYELKKLKNLKAFLALKVSGYGNEGIFNKTLNSFFDWAPGYLIFLNENVKIKKSSPYQIIKIELLKNDQKNIILNSVKPKYQKGAKVFFNTCNKCHSYKDFGGVKAPPIIYLTSKWPEDLKLKKFLRHPQKHSERKIEMSGYTGSDKNLNELIKFLRIIEKDSL